MPYTLRGKLIDPEDVGHLFHIGIGTTTPGQAAVDNLCGYLLVDDPELGRFIEKTDLHSKGTLTQYSSEQVIDRDFVNTPRVTDGDFSGGALQQTWIDPHRFWDSDLDTRTPGYLMLSPKWKRNILVNPAPNAPFQTVAYNNHVWTCPSTGSLIYRGYDGAARNPGINPLLMDTDGQRLYVADGVNTVRMSAVLSDSSWSTLSAAIGTVRQMWAVNLGTAGHFLFYTTAADRSSLKKVDIPSATINIDVPLGDTQFYVVDLCPYLAGVAILTMDPGWTGFDVWYHDGANLQHIIRVDQYRAAGICQCLGQLFVTAISTGLFEPPVLMQVSAGTFQILVRLGTPFTQLTFSYVGDPVSTGQYVAFPIQGPPQITGISSAFGYIGVYDVLGGNYTHLPVMDIYDFPMAGVGLNSGIVPLRQIAFNGRAVAWAQGDQTGNLVMQFQTDAYSFSPGDANYQPFGWLCSSRIDFQTPGIAKLFRRIVVHHAKLNLGEAIQVNAYIDIDPITFTTALAPAGTVTHAYAANDPNPTITVLTFPIRTLGHSLTFALKLTAGTSQQTTPNVFYAAIEIAVPWTWEGWFDLTHRRRMLNGGEDSAQTVQDLYWLLHNAWENAQPVTFYHPNGSPYTAVIEELRFEARNPVAERTPEHESGVEWWAYILLRDSLE